MKKERIILFVCVLAVVLLAPMVLPRLIGGFTLPWWADVCYTVVVLVNGGIYLLNRLVLIDRCFIRGRFTAFAGWNLVALAVGGALQVVLVGWLEGFGAADGIRVADYIGLPARVAQWTLGGILELVVVLIALAVALSDEWRRAAFKYREAVRDKAALEGDVDSLKAKVAALERGKEAPDSIAVKVDLMMTRIPLEEILYVRSDGDYIVIHRSDGTAAMTLMTLKALEKQLPEERFCRVHRSWLVNMDKVRGLKDGKILVGDAAVPLSDSCKPAFFELLSCRSILLRPEQ